MDYVVKGNRVARRQTRTKPLEVKNNIFLFYEQRYNSNQ